MRRNWRTRVAVSPIVIKSRFSVLAQEKKKASQRRATASNSQPTGGSLPTATASSITQDQPDEQELDLPETDSYEVMAIDA